MDLLDDTAKAAQRPQDRMIDLLLRRDLRISYRTEVVRPLQDIFVGRELEALLKTLEKFTDVFALAACLSPYTCTRAMAMCIPIFR